MEREEEEEVYGNGRKDEHVHYGNLNVNVSFPKVELKENQFEDYFKKHCTKGGKSRVEGLKNGNESTEHSLSQVSVVYPQKKSSSSSAASSPKCKSQLFEFDNECSEHFHFQKRKAFPAIRSRKAEAPAVRVPQRGMRQAAAVRALPAG